MQPPEGLEAVQKALATRIQVLLGPHPKKMPWVHLICCGFVETRMSLKVNFHKNNAYVDP